MESSVAQTILPGLLRERWEDFSTKIRADASKRDFGIWAQWAALFSGFLAIILGISNFIDFRHILIFIFAALSIVSGILVFLTEWHRLRSVFFACFRVPASWEAHIAGIHGYTKRAGMYAILAVIQFASISINGTSLIAVAVLFLLLALLNLAAWKQNGDNFTGSEALGGQGDAQRLPDERTTPSAPGGSMFAPSPTNASSAQQSNQPPKPVAGQGYDSTQLQPDPSPYDDPSPYPNTSPRIEPPKPVASQGYDNTQLQPDPSPYDDPSPYLDTSPRIEPHHPPPRY